MRSGILITALLMAACAADADTDTDTDAARSGVAEDGRVATAYASGSDRLTREELEAGRLQMDWREFVERDTTVAAGDSAGGSGANGGANASWNESWEDISPQTVNSGPASLPVHGDVAGPTVLRVQILLDRALFSPGVIDGRWGRNTEKAVYWLQKREGMPATGRVDQATWERLQQLAGRTAQLVRTHALTADDVAGPFVTLPEEYYDRRDMDCQCFESLREKLAERFHVTEDLLAQLNPDVDLNSVQAGRTLNVPVVERSAPSAAMASSASGDSAGGGSATAASGIARLIISDGGRYLHAVDASGRILYHFPATLGSDYSPSPTGNYRITNIAQDPTWHYQPDLLEGVDDSEPDAVLPPGPNNPVGVVWMALSEPHYGIHGTSAPETIGYATSNGCIRLTNWDAKFLSERVGGGTPVTFRDVR